MLEDGRLKMPNIQEFAFDEMDAAVALQSTRHVHGKLAIRIA